MTWEVQSERFQWKWKIDTEEDTEMSGKENRRVEWSANPGTAAMSAGTVQGGWQVALGSPAGRGPSGRHKPHERQIQSTIVQGASAEKERIAWQGLQLVTTAASELIRLVLVKPSEGNHV